MILLCHNTLAKSYDSKVGLIIQKRCILVTVFAALLLPIMLYACYIFCCSLVTNIAVFLVTGYTVVAGANLLLHQVDLCSLIIHSWHRPSDRGIDICGVTYKITLPVHYEIVARDNLVKMNGCR